MPLLDIGCVDLATFLYYTTLLYLTVIFSRYVL